MAEAAIPLLATGGILQASSQFQAGQSASRNATITANQLDQNADLANENATQQEAVGTAKAAENLRQNKYLQSTIINRASADGGSSLSPNVANLVSQTAGEGEYAALNSLYEGNTKADQLRNEAIGLKNQALVTRFEGSQARKAANIGVVTGLIGTGAKGASFQSKYNNPMPQNSNSNAYNNSDFSDAGSFAGDFA